MAYTASWDETAPNGAVVQARDLDQHIKDFKRDIRERLTDVLGIPSFSADPLAPAYFRPTDGTVVGEINHNTVGTRTNHDFYLKSNNTSRWKVLAAGSLEPETDAAYNIGSASKRIVGVYTQFVRSGDYRAEVDGGNVDISAETAPAGINFNTGGGTKWTVYANGNFVPGAVNTYDIGNGTLNPRNIHADTAVWSPVVGGIVGDNLDIYANGVAQLQVQAGALLAVTDNVLDFGTSAGNRPRDIHVGRDVSVSRHLEVDGQAYNKWHDAGSSPATIDWDNGNVQKITLTANTTLAFSNPKQGAVYSLVVAQDATGNRTITWPGTVDWGTSGAPVLSTAANKIDVISFLWDGSQYIGFVGGYGY